MPDLLIKMVRSLPRKGLQKRDEARTNYLASVARNAVRLGPTRAFGDALAEASFFETDSGRFDFRWEAPRFESTRSFVDTGLGAIDIDVFGLFGHLGEDRDFLRRHFGKSPE